MNEDTLTGRLDHIEKSWGGIIKWALYITAALTVLGATLWFLLYSTSLANLPFMIPIRNIYQNTYLTIRRSFFSNNKIPSQYDSIYAIQVSEYLGGGSYAYVFTGKITSIDVDNGLILAEGNDHNSYIVKIVNAGELLTPIFREGGYFLFKWNDTRSLSQIRQGYSENPSLPINNASL